MNNKMKNKRKEENCRKKRKKKNSTKSFPSTTPSRGEDLTFTLEIKSLIIEERMKSIQVSKCTTHQEEGQIFNSADAKTYIIWNIKYK